MRLLILSPYFMYETIPVELTRTLERLQPITNHDSVRSYVYWSRGLARPCPSIRPVGKINILGLIAQATHNLKCILY